MKDYIAISREIKRRGEAKRNARKRHIHHALAACLLLCICLPLGFGVWQLASPAEAPSLPPSSEIVGDVESLQGDAKPPVSLPGEQPEQEESDYSEEPVYSEEPPGEASEEPVYSEEPEYSGEWEGPETDESGEEPDPPCAAPAPSLPQGVTVELYWYETPNWSNDEILGFIALKINGEFDLEKGYIFLTQKGGMLIEQASGGTPLLKSLCEEAGIPFPTHSLTAEEGKLLLEELLDYYS